MADIRNARGQVVPYDSNVTCWCSCHVSFIMKRAMRTIAGVKGVAFALAEEQARCFCRVHALPCLVWLGKENMLAFIETLVLASIAT